MKHFFLALVATTFLLFSFSSSSFAQNFGQTEGDSIDCDISYFQQNWSSFAFKSLEQAMVAQLFGLMSIDIRLDTQDTNVEVNNLQNNSVCLDSIAYYLPNLDVYHLWNVGILSPELDSLCVTYDLCYQLEENRKVNLMITEATLSVVVQIREREVENLREKSSRLEKDVALVQEDFESVLRVIDFLEEVMILIEDERLKKKCGNIVVANIKKEMSKKQLNKLKRKFKICQCLAKRN